jgi:murein DD-endopeptidase MepM/ murein hydrolase activator NlpD
MAITTTRTPRADRWGGWRAVMAASIAVSMLQLVAPSFSMAQVAAPKKPQQLRVQPKAKAVNPANVVSPTDMEADNLNQKWLSDFNKTDKPVAEAPAPIAQPVAAQSAAPVATQALTAAPQAAPESIVGTESELTSKTPTLASLPGAGARIVVPNTTSFVKADNAAAAFNFLPGGANQPMFKGLTEAFAGFAPSAANAAKVQMMQARTADGSSRLVYASIGEGANRQSYWWFSPPSQPEGWFDEHGKRLGDTAMGEPKPGAKISSPFGTRRFYGRVTSTAFHNGIDFEGKVGEPIYAAADGVVNHANWYYNYGRTVKITHADNLETLYAHMSRIASNIAPGTQVHKGDVIGYIGATGRATGPHLHFSLIADGKFVDPQPYISEGGGSSTLGGNDLVAYRQWQADIRAAALSQKGGAQRASWSRSPFPAPQPQL